MAFDAGDRFVKFRVSGEQQGQECEAGWIVERTAGRETLSFPGRQSVFRLRGNDDIDSYREGLTRGPWAESQDPQESPPGSCSYE